MMKHVLIIDDDPEFRKALSETVSDLGYETSEASSVGEALEMTAGASLFAVLIDFKMPYINGVDGIAILKKRPELELTPIVMITSFRDAGTTVKAMATGAFDYLTKPVSRKQIEAVFERIKQEYAETSLNEPFDVEDADSGFICTSSEMREVLKTVGKVAGTAASVLITGETGTGKELIAKMIHDYSPRAKSPFVAINCAAIPRDLLESELFGHVKGAFTGAVSDREGAFLRAKNGTIFLDEIGDLDFALQAKLLRVLQERELTPVGSTKTFKVDARFVSASHQNLARKVRDGLFREDLRFRINAVELSLPPLRDRKDDIPPLVSHFLKSFPGKRLSADAVSKVLGYDWPGNIRELRNVIEHAALLTQGPVIGPDAVNVTDVVKAPAIAPPISDPRAESPVEPDKSLESASFELTSKVADLEKGLISAALERANQNRTEAAKSLGIGRQQLYAKMKEHGLSK